MDVKVAKTAGFCFGVKRAVEEVYKVAETTKGTVYTYGPIIHNEEVIKDMRDKGVIVLRSEEDLDMISQGTVIIRSHGVEKRIYEKIEQKGLRIVDATCPFVKKIHNIVSEKSGEGFHIIIIGNPEHPEVVGIKGWAKDNVTVIQSAEDAECFTADRKEKICIVSQTIMLSAVEKGYGGCMIGSCKRVEILEAVELDPQRYSLALVLALGKPKEEVRMVPVGEDGSTTYYRDENQVHYVPKRALEDILV